MKHDSVVELKKKEPFIDDAITDILRKGVRQLLAQALEAEIELYISQFAEMRDEQGRQASYANGYRRSVISSPESADVPVRAPRCATANRIHRRGCILSRRSCRRSS